MTWNISAILIGKYKPLSHIKKAGNMRKKPGQRITRIYCTPDAVISYVLFYTVFITTQL